MCNVLCRLSCLGALFSHCGRGGPQPVGDCFDLRLWSRGDVFTWPGRRKLKMIVGSTRERTRVGAEVKKKKKMWKKKRRGRVESFFSGHPETGQLAATGGGTTFSSIFPLCYRIGDNDCSTRRQIRAICWKKISHRPLSPVTEASNSPGGSTQTFRRVLTFLCAISPPLRIQSQAAHAAD